MGACVRCVSDGRTQIHEHARYKIMNIEHSWMADVLHSVPQCLDIRREACRESCLRPGRGHRPHVVRAPMVCQNVAKRKDSWTRAAGLYPTSSAQFALPGSQSLELMQRTLTSRFGTTRPQGRVMGVKIFCASDSSCASSYVPAPHNIGIQVGQGSTKWYTVRTCRRRHRGCRKLGAGVLFSELYITYRGQGFVG